MGSNMSRVRLANKFERLGMCLVQIKWDLDRALESEEEVPDYVEAWTEQAKDDIDSALDMLGGNIAALRSTIPEQV